MGGRCGMRLLILILILILDEWCVLRVACWAKRLAREHWGVTLGA